MREVRTPHLRWHTCLNDCEKNGCLKWSCEAALGKRSSGVGSLGSMGVRGFARRLNDPGSVAHGVVSTGLVAGLALIEPRKLTTGRRLAYRGAVAAVTAWTVWASLRPGSSSEADPLGPVARAAVTTGAAGATLGVAEVGEAIDARLHDGLARAGARRPRLWLAAAEAAVSAAAWWAGRLGDRMDVDDADTWEEPTQFVVDLPEDVRALAALLLSATDECGAPELRAQLDGARLVSYDKGRVETGFAQFDTPEGLPRAVPGDATFPVIGRFRALEDRTFDVRLVIENGRLDSIHIREGADWTPAEQEAWDDAGHDITDLGAWPSPEQIDLLVETPAGYQVLQP